MGLPRVLLHQAETIAFGIGDVRKIADALDAVLLSRDRAAVRDDRGKRAFQIIAVDRADKPQIAGAAVLSLAQIAMETSGRLVDEIIIRRSPRTNLPGEHALVKPTRAFHVVAFDLEVHDCMCHDGLRNSSTRRRVLSDRAAQVALAVEE